MSTKSPIRSKQGKGRKGKPPPDYRPYFKSAEAHLSVLFTFEYQFHPDRKWKFDAAIVCCDLAIEVEGWGHNSSAKYLKDIEKYNAATLEGWSLLRFLPKEIKTLTYIDTLEKFLHNHPCTHQKINEALRKLI